MPDYDFKLLSSSDFEMLVRDLLQQELGIRLESFKSGRDQGIDLRYSSSNYNELIVQCKHFANTPFTTLLSQLQREESLKVKQLRPQRYILATSLGLSPKNKESIREALQPFCQTTADIFGKEDLNNLLAKHPEVERQHFKLWLTSVAVLQRILQSEVFNQTEAYLESIRRKLRCYVQTESFTEALKILHENHYCIITGIPGIGKTTLAEVLLIHHLGLGYTAYLISGDITEAFKVYNRHEKQIFVFLRWAGVRSRKSVHRPMNPPNQF